jgi:Domain of unknown function (DUF4157)
MNTRVLAQTKPSSASAPPIRSKLLQRKCACGGTLGPTGECEECRNRSEAKTLQRKVGQPSTLNHQHSEVPPIVHEVLQSSGQPLDPATRAFMELRFNHDFSHVRVHTDTKAAESADAVTAQAYTVGRDIVFRENKYAPATHAGRELVAHELAHTIQQQKASGALSSREQDGILESSANAAARRVAMGQGVAGDLPACGFGLLRQANPIHAKATQKLSTKDQKRRERAIGLKAADARALLQAKLPFVLKQMTEDQIAQMQRVLDASVINPSVEKEVAEREREAIVAESGGYVRDPRKERRAQQASRAFVPVSEADKRIRLDYEKLLAPDALNVRTDSPDEAAYLGRVRKTLEARGVWLRFTQKLVHDPEDPSRWISDPRDFEVWLSLGPDGDHIPSESGRLTRESILGTTVLGAGYYENVDTGKVQSALNREIKRLRSALESGFDQHVALRKIRDQAPFGVAEISDVLGGANFPDQSIWDQPNELVLRALTYNVGGNVTASQVYLVVAGVLTRNAAQLLADYINDTSTGVERAVKVLEVARTAGKVAEVGLTVTGGIALVRGGMALAGAGAVEAGSVDAAAERLTRQYIAKNPEIAEDLANVRYVPQPKGSIGGYVKPAHSWGAGTGWHTW